MMPASSSSFCLRWQGEGDRPTVSPSSTVVARPSCCRCSSMAISIRSRRIDGRSFHFAPQHWQILPENTAPAGNSGKKHPRSQSYVQALRQQVCPAFQGGRPAMDIGFGTQGITLESRYVERGSPVLLTGIQALVRLLLEQARLDRAAGHHTAGLVSGYRGSPLGGLDQELWRREKLLV